MFAARPGISYPARRFFSLVPASKVCPTWDIKHSEIGSSRLRLPGQGRGERLALVSPAPLLRAEVEKAIPASGSVMTISTLRFAPSPNGYLHLGHALSAILNFDMARRTGGRFLLRIEDIDATRCRPEYEAAILDDLAWLGLGWEGPVRRQSAHFDAYAAALGRLEAMGLIYPSFESRAEIARLVAARERTGPWPRDPDGVPIYPGEAKTLDPAERARRMAAGPPYALRL